MAVTRKSAGDKAAGGKSAARRTLDILELLAANSGGLSITDIGERLKLPKSGVHRLLAMLIEKGFVQQDANSADYALTMKLGLMGLRQYAGLGINDVAQPILDRLARDSGELARLTIVDNERLIWVAKAQGARHGLRYDPDTGFLVALHPTAVGAAWLSTLPEKDAVRIVTAAGFPRAALFGPNVVRTIDALKAKLRDTRARGYGLALEEAELGTAAVAVTFRVSPQPDAQVAGTLSLAGPITRFPAERRAEFARTLAAAAQELSAIWPLRAGLVGRSPAALPPELADAAR